MLNKIGDDAAEEMLAFYRSHLDRGVEASAKYEAHYAIALLTWRKKGQAAMEEIVGHFQAAAAEAINIFFARENKPDRGREDLFNFMFPLFVIYIFGGTAEREQLSSLSREQWGPVEDDEYQSLIELFDLLRGNSVSRVFADDDILRVVEANNNFITHPFYQPWIKCFCDCLLSINKSDEGGTKQSIETLIELHDDEAYDGNWSKTPEGLMGFWPLAAKITAQLNGVNVDVTSAYVPEIEDAFLR